MTIVIEPQVELLPSISEDIHILCEVPNSNAYLQPAWFGTDGDEILQIGQGELGHHEFSDVQWVTRELQLGLSKFG